MGRRLGSTGPTLTRVDGDGQAGDREHDEHGEDPSVHPALVLCIADGGAEATVQPSATQLRVAPEAGGTFAASTLVVVNEVRTRHTFQTNLQTFGCKRLKPSKLAR
jgi:hypothetical protein